METALRELIAKWRDEADGVTAMGYAQQGDRMRDCADELETLLGDAPAKKPPCYTCVWVYERVCRQLAEPKTDDQAALTEIISAIEREQEGDAPAATASPSGWEPIETAPKDGRRILVWEPEFGETGRCAIVVALYKQYSGPHTGRWISEFGRWNIPGPTHWRPLPPAPQTGEQP